MTKQMKPVKAWAEFSKQWAVEGKPKAIQNIAEAAFNAGVESSEWMTRAEFEAIELEPSWGVWVWYLVDGVGELLHALYCQEDNEYICNEDHLDKDRIAYLQPIHAPSAPSEVE